MFHKCFVIAQQCKTILCNLDVTDHCFLEFIVINCELTFIFMSGDVLGYLISCLPMVPHYCFIYLFYLAMTHIR